MEDPMAVADGVAVPLEEVTVRVSRSAGPGGQHANVTASRVEASFDVEASRALSPAQKERVLGRAGPRITAMAQDTRSQARNRELALERLRARLAAALAIPHSRRPTRPSQAARERRLREKRLAAERKRGRRRPTGEDAPRDEHG